MRFTHCIVCSFPFDTETTLINTETRLINFKGQDQVNPGQDHQHPVHQHPAGAKARRFMENNPLYNIVIVTCLVWLQPDQSTRKLVASQCCSWCSQYQIANKRDGQSTISLCRTVVAQTLPNIQCSTFCGIGTDYLVIFAHPLTLALLSNG